MPGSYELPYAVQKMHSAGVAQSSSMPISATDLLSSGARGVGYLLKDRVADVADFVTSVKRVAEGGTALDPEAVAQLLVPAGPDDPLASLTRGSGENGPRFAALSDDLSRSLAARTAVGPEVSPRDP